LNPNAEPLTPDLPPKLEQEVATLGRMIDLYCRGHHPAPHPCKTCRSLLRYARGRLGACPFGEEKPVCSKCPIHCYGKVMRARVRDVMRYAGPRMMLHHPVSAVRHLVREKMPVKDLIEYLPDDTIDEAMNQRIIDLLTTCFTGPNDIVFRTRRYFAEPYPNRWIIRDGDRLAAHIGVHEKQVETGDEVLPVGGVAEVCVHPDHRGRGHVKRMLQVIHPWMQRRRFVYAVLFGNPQVYGSSGYMQQGNLWHHSDGQRKRLNVMVLPLGDRPWPEGEVYLPGPTF
jgi:predicted N-acetyltransferase YhbS